MMHPLSCLLAAATAFPPAPGPARGAETPAIVAVALPPSDAVQAPAWDVALVYRDLGPMVSTEPAAAGRAEKRLPIDLDALEIDAAPVESGSGLDRQPAPTSTPE